MKLPNLSEMDCRRVGDLLSQYADGDLPAHRRALVQAHLDGCPARATHLQTLREAIAFLEADTKTPLPVLPDLYAGFRERLVTQPSGSSPLARRAQRAGGAWHLVRLGMAGMGLVAAAGVSLVWHRHVAVLNETIQNLRLPNHNATFMRYVALGSKTSFAQGYRQSDTIWKDGYRWNSGTISASNQFYRDTILTTPGGISMTWRTPLNGAKMPPVVHLYWNPADPSQPQNTELQYLFGMFRHWLKQLAHSNKMLFADIQTAQETIGGERMNKLTIHRLNTALDAQPMYNGEYFEPSTLILWFDASKRLRQYRQEFRSPAGAERSEQETIAYDQNPPFDIANAPLPKDWPVVVALNSPPRTIPPASIVNPLWHTMSALEKRELQGVADRFARAWASRNVAQLRAVVDINRPLEVTRPSGRIAMRVVPESTPSVPSKRIAIDVVNESTLSIVVDASHVVDHSHLTAAQMKERQRKEVHQIEEMQREDVWHYVWAERLAYEPARSDYHITPVYAYDAANKPLLDKEPLKIPAGSTDVALPGVNVLAWVSEKDAQGRESGYAARLFLVKRGSEWKVWQFAREAARPNTGGWDEDNN